MALRVRPGARGEVLPMTTARAPSARRPLPLADRPAVLASGTLPYRLSAQLVVVGMLAALPTLVRPALLSGPEVMVGSARGTALVLLGLTLPVLLLAAHATSRGSARGLVVWLGALAHLAYQGVLLCFATPLNALFLLYVATLGLAVWTGVVVLLRTDVRALASRFPLHAPVRPAAAVLGTVAVLNAAAWLARVVPSITADDPTDVLDGSGLTTNPVIVQDLALWLPLAVVAAVLLWRRAAAGILGAGSMLVMWTLEGVTVATDQLFGHAADPTTEWATTGAAGMFAVLTVVTGLPLLQHLRSLDG